ncbi:HAD family hydrolase [Companilactobacillus keshanensis]|uniref:HAD family hydrolase n=1 Tax=Companilactobacillus keshanensis TaxID=2486003 RepID=A0ABW4BWM7_9LACO|nr:HAD family hydrolase [Companilactobacillus keshanensis]
MSQYKLAFFDIDGTLASHNDPKIKSSMVDRVPESTRLAIKELKKSGIEPIIATGRNHGMIRDLLQSLNISSFIANNGRYVVFNDQTIAHDVFSRDHLQEIVKYFKSKHIDYCFETNDHLYLNKSSKFLDDGAMDLDKIPDGEIPDKVIQMIVRSKESFDIPIGGIEAVKVAPGVFDITMENSNKAVGIDKILSAMKIRVGETLAFGDEENDIEMFEKAGYTIAMGNGIPQIKKLADFVTTDVNDDGIWNACIALKLF